jgi:hypothetical protein
LDQLSHERVLPSVQSGGAPIIPKRRWRIAWLLGLGVLVKYFDRVNLSVSHGALTATFGISDITFGFHRRNAVSQRVCSMRRRNLLRQLAFH